MSLTSIADQNTENPVTILPSEPAAQSLHDSSLENWDQVSDLPFDSWKEAVRTLGKRIAGKYPRYANKVSLWFAPMPLERVLEHGNDIRLQFACSSKHRKTEVESLQSIIEETLADEWFPGRRVYIDLIERFEDNSKSDRILDAASTIHIETVQNASVEEPKDDLPQTSPPSVAPPLPQPCPLPKTPHSDHELLDFFRQRLNANIADEDLRAVITALRNTQPHAIEAFEAEQKAQQLNSESPKSSVRRSLPSTTRLNEILLEPSYATTYDEIVRDHSAIYLPAYFVRHLRHMGASDGLRFMALRQIAYRHGFRETAGTKLFSTTVNELCRWSTLQPRRIYGGLDDPAAYLFLLAGKVPYIDYYASRPENTRWEDALGYHWKTGGREYCVWKRNGQPTNECSQLIPDRATGEPQWRQAPMVYRVQLSMPLCPEDEKSLRAALIAFGVREDPLNAIQQCLALPRADLIPDRPTKLNPMPRKLYTVQELVMETWGRPTDRELAARVAIQAKLLETHVISDRDLLKIPFYLLEKWGPYLSPAQLWTAIIAMDRVYAGRKDGEYRDTTLIRDGLKEMTLWTEEEYSRGAARKIGRWLYPYTVGDEDSSEHFNPWFSVFAAEILPENGARAKNADNSVQMKLRVLPLVPLCPEDTLQFAHKMGHDRLAVRDAAGKMLALEITDEELAVYIPDGRTLRYSHRGELRFGEPGSILLQTRDRQLSGIEILTSDVFYETEQWPEVLFGSLETRSAVYSGSLESQPSVLSDGLENQAPVLFGSLALDPTALFGMLLKLLIQNLYGLKKNALEEKPPSSETPPENVDSLEQFGSRQGQYIGWTEVNSESDWDFSNLVKALGIADVRGLKDNGVTAVDIVTTALELYATPADKFTTSRVAVLVAKLRANPHPQPGVFLRLAELGPEMLQDNLRRAILNVTPLLNDPDWNQTLGRAKRNDLIDLAEKLGLARVFRSNE